MKCSTPHLAVEQLSVFNMSRFSANWGLPEDMNYVFPIRPGVLQEQRNALWTSSRGPLSTWSLKATYFFSISLWCSTLDIPPKVLKGKNQLNLQKE